MSSEPSLTAGHPIKVVSRRTGISADVLRAWEKRYGAVVPFRSSTGRRLYSDADVDRLLLLRRALESGRSIGQVARLSLEELRPLVETDEAAVRSSPGPRPVAATRPRGSDGGQVGEAGDLLDAARQAVRELDQQRLQDALDEAAVRLSRPKLVEAMLLPMLRRIGEDWERGEIRPVHEHLASAVVRSFVGMMREREASPSAPRLVATTPPGQLHELGALLAAAVASALGWSATYLGPNLPVEDIAAAARQLGARAVALSVIYPSADLRLAGELRRLRAQLAPGVLLLVGGAGAAGLGPLLVEIGGTLLSDVSELPSLLASHRSS